MWIFLKMTFIAKYDIYSINDFFFWQIFTILRILLGPNNRSKEELFCPYYATFKNVGDYVTC
jgi:hypothetical protein